jgi:CTP:molybdopterin cytidylyltransferase MocA
VKAILLSGYRASEFNEEPLGLNRGADGTRLLDAQIHQLSQLGLEVVCVVAGEAADQQLRVCPRIANTELAYDTSEQVSLASNVKAGLTASDGEACFIIPVEVIPPSGDQWRFLLQEWRRLGAAFDASVLQAVDPQGAPWHFGFPLLITRKGNQLIQKLSGFHSLTDPRLIYHHVAYQGESILAPPSKAA